MLGDLLISSDDLTITAYKEVERNGDTFASEEVGSFTALINPDSIRRSYQQSFQKSGGINTSGQQARYSRSLPQRVQVTLILDDTGATATGINLGPLSNRKSVQEQVDEFMELCYDYDSDKHQPLFLKLAWGEFQFSCRLQNVELTYSLFDKGGKPHRAELDTVFLEDLSVEDLKKRENKQSPDITHARIVQAGDTLPLLAKKVYGSSGYYLKLAKANELDHFRELSPGIELRFPPLPELEAKS